MVTRYGITGPASGLSLEQERFVADTTLFVLMDSDPIATEFWSGCAEGVDSIGIAAAERARIPLVGFTIPQVRDGTVTRPLHSNADALIEEYIEEYAGDHIQWVVEYAPPGRDVSDGYMKRNTLTISKIDRLLAFPPNLREPTNPRGGVAAGTWSTIRRARAAALEIWFYPLDGSKPRCESPDPVERMIL